MYPHTKLDPTYKEDRFSNIPGSKLTAMAVILNTGKAVIYSTNWIIDFYSPRIDRNIKLDFFFWRIRIISGAKFPDSAEMGVKSVSAQ